MKKVLGAFPATAIVGLSVSGCREGDVAGATPECTVHEVEKNIARARIFSCVDQASGERDIDAVFVYQKDGSELLKIYGLGLKLTSIFFVILCAGKIHGNLNRYEKVCINNGCT